MKIPEGLPKKAMRIWRYIKNNVPRPKEKPDFNPVLRFGHACPMGLCQFTIFDTPAYVGNFDFPKNFKPWSQREIMAYFRWWDCLLNPEEAVEMQWGK